MKENEVPDTIYLEKVYPDNGVLPNGLNYNQSPTDIEYTRTDAFIEKACEFLKSYRQDTYDGMGYIAGIVNDKTIEDFRNYMKGE